jgi:hypothetical protein
MSIFSITMLNIGISIPMCTQYCVKVDIANNGYYNIWWQNCQQQIECLGAIANNAMVPIITYSHKVNRVKKPRVTCGKFGGRGILLNVFTIALIGAFVKMSSRGKTKKGNHMEMMMGGFFDTKMEGMEMVMGIMFELLEVRGHSSWQLGTDHRILGKIKNKKKELEE